MMYVHLKPITLVFSPIEAKHKVLSLEEHKLVIPSISPQPNADLKELINYMLDKYLSDNTPALNKIKLVDAEIVEDNINIYYLVFIGYETNTKNAHLIPIDKNNENFPPSVKQILSLLA